MKIGMLGMWLAGFCLVGAIGSAQAEMAYTDVGGGGGGNLRTREHIDFALQFNSQFDDSNGVNDGGGLWIGYRHSLSENLSLGGKLGIHTYTIDNAGFHDTVSSVPLLFTAQLEQKIDRSFNIYGQVGLGPCFNSIHGDAADAFDITLGTSLALDFAFGGTFDIDRNIALGLTFDLFLSTAPVDSPSAFVDDHLDVSHFGFGFIFVGSF